MWSMLAFNRESDANSGESILVVVAAGACLSQPHRWTLFWRMIYCSPSLRLRIREVNSLPSESSIVASKGTAIGSAPPFCPLWAPPLTVIKRCLLNSTGCCRSIKLSICLLYRWNIGFKWAGIWTSPWRAFTVALQTPRITNAGAFSNVARTTLISGPEAKNLIVSITSLLWFFSFCWFLFLFGVPSWALLIGFKARAAPLFIGAWLVNSWNYVRRSPGTMFVNTELSSYVSGWWSNVRYPCFWCVKHLKAFNSQRAFLDTSGRRAFLIGWHRVCCEIIHL